MSFEDNDPLAIIAGVITAARARLETIVRFPNTVIIGAAGNVPLDVRAGRDLQAIFDSWDRALAAIDAASVPLHRQLASG